MIVKNKDQRVVVLVDVQNLYYSARNLYKARISFKNLLGVAVAGRILTRAIAYVIKSDVSDQESEFFNAVNDAGFEIKEKELQIFPGGAKKGDWDVGIVMDAVRLGTKVDSVVLVSGDGDFVPAVNYLQQSLGCLVEVVAFDKTCSKALRDVADDFISIESHAKTLLFKTAKSRRGSGRVSARGAKSYGKARARTPSRVAKPVVKRSTPSGRSTAPGKK